MSSIDTMWLWIRKIVALVFNCFCLSFQLSTWMHDLFIAKEWDAALSLWTNNISWTFLHPIYAHALDKTLLRHFTFQASSGRFYFEWVHICCSLLTAIDSSAVCSNLTLRGIYWFSINGSWRLFLCFSFTLLFFSYKISKNFSSLYFPRRWIFLRIFFISHRRYEKLKSKEFFLCTHSTFFSLFFFYI